MRILLSPFFAACVAILSLLGIVMQSEWASLPPLHVDELYSPQQSMIIEDRHGGELFRYYAAEDRVWIKLQELPPHVPAAFVSIEDKRFYSRQCIDVRATIRAIIENMRDYKSQGASTITQQLIRTVYLDRGKTFERKIREIMLACKLELALEKDAILELYVNWVSFGHGIAGVEQASKRFFGKSARDLTIAEAAVLAALPQRPSYFSPYGPHRYASVNTKTLPHTSSGVSTTRIMNTIVPGLLPRTVVVEGKSVPILGRSNTVLRAMKEQSLITSDAYAQASSNLTSMSFQENAIRIHAPHFVQSLKIELDSLFRADTRFSHHAGLRVRTTIDPALQSIAEDVITRAHTRLAHEANAQNLALLAADRKTGKILAYVGNSDFFDDTHNGQIDMVRTPRPVGSTLKPFIYATLLEMGRTPETTIYDSPLDRKIYAPASLGFYGKMTIRTALARSRNTPAVRAFYEIGGEEQALDVLGRVGIHTPRWFKQSQTEAGFPYAYSWTLILGAAEASMLELLQGYSTFAQEGIFSPLIGVQSIADESGIVIFKPVLDTVRVWHASTAQEMTDILSDENAREPSWRFLMHLPHGKAAIKTGTAATCTERNFFGACLRLLPTSDWGLGYDDDLLVGVWVGNATNEPMLDSATSIMSAMPIWQEFMILSHAALHPLP